MIECPSCSGKLNYGATECSCGWHIPTRKPAHAQLHSPQLRPRHAGHFKTQAELDQHEHDQLEIAAHFRRRLADRQGELDQVPRHRRWAKEILIRAEEGDPRVTQAMREMAREALPAERAA